MVLECNINCRTMDLGSEDLLGMPDPGKWLPFIIDLDQVYAAKLSSEDEDELTYLCTTIFCYDGDTYIIDTNFEKFKKIFIKFKNQTDVTN
jgi:hypothetical protein